MNSSYISSFKERILSAYKVEVEKTKNIILKTFFTEISHERDEEMKSFVHASIGLQPSDELSVKILNLFISFQDKYLLINFDEKNIVIKTEEEFIAFMQRTCVTVKINDGYKNEKYVSYSSRMHLDSDESRYFFSNTISHLTSNKNQNALTLNTNINSLFQKMLLIVYKEFQTEIKKKYQTKLPSVG